MSPIAIENDPVLALDQLRTDDPVHWDSNFDGWVISRYEDVKSLLGNSKALGQAYKQTQRHLISKHESEEIANQKMAPESPSSKITKDWLRFNDAPTILVPDKSWLMLYPISLPNQPT
jgi:hypothetical protein